MTRSVINFGQRDRLGDRRITGSVWPPGQLGGGGVAGSGLSRRRRDRTRRRNARVAPSRCARQNGLEPAVVGDLMREGAIAAAGRLIDGTRHGSGDRRKLSIVGIEVARSATSGRTGHGRDVAKRVVGRMGGLDDGRGRDTSRLPGWRWRSRLARDRVAAVEGERSR